MPIKKKKIVVTGGNGRFAIVLKKINKRYKIFFPNKKKLNITKENSLRNYIKKVKPEYLLHCAALSRPMKLHDEEITKSINLNIIGTCNVVKVCDELNIKLIYFSTTYVYKGTKGNYRETDPVLPFNNYAWSKLGGECAVQMYKNSLILRCCMTEKPFVHKAAFANVKSNFIFHEDLAKIFLKVINKFGIYNIGGKSQTIYNFVKKHNKDIKKVFSSKQFPLKQNMSLNKLYKNIK